MYLICALCLLNISAMVVCSSEKFTDLLNSTATSTTLPAYLVGKHESLQTCLATSSEPGEYEIISNGSAFIKRDNMTLNETLYVLMNDTLIYCIPFDSGVIVEKEHLSLTSYLTVIGLSLSMIGLFLHLLVFSLMPALRNRTGWNIAALCASLFISYSLFFLFGSENIKGYRESCVVLASMTHFFLLSSFLWMFIISYDISMTLLCTTESSRISSTQFSIRKFGVYCLCAFGFALLLTALGVLADILDVVPQAYRPKFHTSCWFSQKIPFIIFFAGPVAVLSCTNFLMFGISVYVIHFTKMKSVQDAKKSLANRRYLTYFRLSVIMGVTWNVGTVANVTNVEWVWVLFILLNTLQGLFIFLTFTCTKKVLKTIYQKFLSRTNNQQTPATHTADSYCNYGNSVETK